MAHRDICGGCTKPVGIGAKRTSPRVYEYTAENHAGERSQPYSRHPRRPPPCNAMAVGYLRALSALRADGPGAMAHSRPLRLKRRAAALGSMQSMWRQGRCGALCQPCGNDRRRGVYRLGSSPGNVRAIEVVTVTMDHGAMDTSGARSGITGGAIAWGAFAVWRV